MQSSWKQFLNRKCISMQRVLKKVVGLILLNEQSAKCHVQDKSNTFQLFYYTELLFKIITQPLSVTRGLIYVNERFERLKVGHVMGCGCNRLYSVVWSVAGCLFSICGKLFVFCNYMGGIVVCCV